MKRSLQKTFVYVGLSLGVLAGCSKAADHRQNQRNENEANTKAQMMDLQAAEGQFRGVMHMKRSHQDFIVALDLKRIYENARTNQGSDPTQTINIPKLSGSMTFPTLERLGVSEYANFSELTDPLGGFAKALFDFGDYDPQTHLMVLPYNVSGYTQGNFGELSGQLENGVFVGTWYAKPLDLVGTFELKQITAGGAQ